MRTTRTSTLFATLAALALVAGCSLFGGQAAKTTAATPAAPASFRLEGEPAQPNPELAELVYMEFALPIGFEPSADAQATLLVAKDGYPTASDPHRVLGTIELDAGSSWSPENAEANAAALREFAASSGATHVYVVAGPDGRPESTQLWALRASSSSPEHEPADAVAEELAKPLGDIVGQTTATLDASDPTTFEVPMKRGRCYRFGFALESDAVPARTQEAGVAFSTYAPRTDGTLGKTQGTTGLWPDDFDATEDRGHVAKVETCPIRDIEATIELGIGVSRRGVSGGPPPPTGTGELRVFVLERAETLTKRELTDKACGMCSPSGFACSANATHQGCAPSMACLSDVNVKAAACG